MNTYKKMGVGEVLLLPNGHPQPEAGAKSIVWKARVIAHCVNLVKAQPNRAAP
jgi:hypothetical protein